jgi:hypothetical protein
METKIRWKWWGNWERVKKGNKKGGKKVTVNNPIDPTDTVTCKRALDVCYNIINEHGIIDGMHKSRIGRMRLHAAFGHCAKPHPKQKIWGHDNIYLTRIHVKQVYSRPLYIEAVRVEHQQCIRGANNSAAWPMPWKKRSSWALLADEIHSAEDLNVSSVE